MSRHDPKATLHQIADNARRARELCTQNTLPQILADWQKRAAFERVMEVLGEAVKRLPFAWFASRLDNNRVAKAFTRIQLENSTQRRKVNPANPNEGGW